MLVYSVYVMYILSHVKNWMNLQFLPLVLMLWVLSETVLVLVYATRMNLFAHSL